MQIRCLRLAAATAHIVLMLLTATTAVAATVSLELRSRALWQASGAGSKGFSPAVSNLVVEVVDLATGAVVARDYPDEEGRIVFSGLDRKTEYQAQTAGGRHVSRRFYGDDHGFLPLPYREYGLDGWSFGFEAGGGVASVGRGSVRANLGDQDAFSLRSTSQGFGADASVDARWTVGLRAVSPRIEGIWGAPRVLIRTAVIDFPSDSGDFEREVTFEAQTQTIEVTFERDRSLAVELGTGLQWRVPVGPSELRVGPGISYRLVFDQFEWTIQDDRDLGDGDLINDIENGERDLIHLLVPKIDIELPVARWAHAELSVFATGYYSILLADDIKSERVTVEVESGDEQPAEIDRSDIGKRGIFQHDAGAIFGLRVSLGR